MVKIRFVLRSGEKKESWVRSLPDAPPPAEKSNSRAKKPAIAKKRLLLGVRKTIVHASRKLPPGGRCDFKFDTIDKQKRETLYVTLRPGLRGFLQAAKKASFEIVLCSKLPKSIISVIREHIDPSGEIITDSMLRTSHSDMLKGQPLHRTVMIDHEPKLRGKPWSNAIKVSSFSGDKNDVEMSNLQKFLKAQKNITDVRDLVNVYSKDSSLPGLPLPETTLKTLFLDLDETLIYHKKLHEEAPDQYDFTTDKNYIIKRPGVDWLLELAVDSGYEIVIFTAGSRQYASQIIDKLDPMGLITYRLYNDSCRRDSEGNCIKDLVATGRDLARCVIFDDKIDKVLPRENAVGVKPFTGQKEDNELRKYLMFFAMESIHVDLRTPAKRMNELLQSKPVTGRW